MAIEGRTGLGSMRVDQVGSLLRPEGLKQVYARHGSGQATDEELRRAQDEAIREVVAKQEARNLPVVTDGEYRRLNFQDSFAESVAGLAGRRNSYQFQEARALGGQPLQHWDPDDPRSAESALRYWPPVEERLRLVRNRPLEEFAFAQGLTGRPVKITLISADRIADSYRHPLAKPVYPDIDSFFKDVAMVQRQIVHGLAEAGCQYVQTDAPSYTAYVDPRSLEQMRARGEDPADVLRRSIQADNQVISGSPGVTFGIHLCRGNQRSMWHRQGPYDAISEQVFNELAHDRFLLEYDTARAGGFEPLRFVPKGKTVVLGLITTKTPQLESAGQLKRRIDEASRYVPLEQLALSPQCGFASNILGNLLTEDDQWRKLELMLETAAQVWGTT